MDFPSDWFPMMLNLISVIGLLWMYPISALGVQRRRHWVLASAGLQSSAVSRERTRQAVLSQRAVEFVDCSLRRVYYAIVILCVVSGIALSFSAVHGTSGLGHWMVNIGTTWAGGLILVRYWSWFDHEHDEKRSLDLREVVSRVLAVSASVPGSASSECPSGVWLRDVGVLSRRSIHVVSQATFLEIRIVGLAALREAWGDQAAGRIVNRVGQEISNNVRATDLVWRRGDVSFGVALNHCRREYGQSVFDRVVTNVNRLVIRWANQELLSDLHLEGGLIGRQADAALPVRCLPTAPADAPLPIGAPTNAAHAPVGPSVVWATDPD